MYVMENSLKSIEALHLLVGIGESLIDDYQGVARYSIGFEYYKIVWQVADLYTYVCCGESTESE